MKNKKVTYLLIFCVLAVWGIIFYRVYAGINEEESLAPLVKSTKPVYFKEVDHAHDRFVLQFDYADPFADEPAVPEIPVAKAVDVTPTPNYMVPAMAKPQVNWTGILYVGQIFNPTTKKRIVIININGKESMLTQGESAHGLKLLKNAGDSVKVLYQNSTKYLSLK
ncbi:hypothetical protein [Pedobacter rhizosphaerae]|uniref:Type IV pilus biogenesis n=1 Tax=Pedobacter rhizosphaerae TaxID=390241 RepID=A0A1H9W6J8_9SPHI|nr:hypothetical protein [Pedobacter rhizosphaerae]SES29596.1 hypothetical protein SAMN04488023_16012 [Pedobacter rhizosphaerae]